MSSNDGNIIIHHHKKGNYIFHAEHQPPLLFCDNETNYEQLYHTANKSLFTKDGINEFLVHGNHSAVNINAIGTKVAANYDITVAPGDSYTVRLRLQKKILHHILSAILKIYLRKE